MAEVEKLSAKEILNDFKENYYKVRKLLDEDSRNDPENQPYLSKYKAKEILSSMDESLLKNANLKDLFEGNVFEAMLGAVLLNIGIIDMEIDELTSSATILTDAVTFLSPHSSKPEIIITLINVYNNLGILWFKREQPERVKTYLLQAKEAYENFKCTLQMPLPLEHILSNIGETLVGDFMLLEKAHTLTLYYLAQVYGFLDKKLKSAVYCHVTLRRQLQYQDFDPIDWALNSATLSQFFAQQNGFFQARHHLAAASSILDQYGETLEPAENNDEVQLAKLETFKHRSADVARCWVKYCILLMVASKDRLMYDGDILDTITDLTNLPLDDSENICGGNIKNLVFPDLDVAAYENKVTDKFLLMYQDAREVFLACQTWLNKAKEYYSLETLASDYIELIMDCSTSYSYLAFFEEDSERRAKMHKRRIDMFEELLKEINPVYYLQFCKQLWLELGQVHSEILNIKLDKMKKCKDKPTPNTLKKINTLAEKSIEYYEKYLESMKDKNGKLPAKIDPDFVRPVVSVYVSVASQSMKRVGLDKEVRLTHVMKSYDSYQAVVDICQIDPIAARMMKEEYALCQEMVKILPLKIKKLKTDLGLVT